MNDVGQLIRRKIFFALPYSNVIIGGEILIIGLDRREALFELYSKYFGNTLLIWKSISNLIPYIGLLKDEIKICDLCYISFDFYLGEFMLLNTSL